MVVDRLFKLVKFALIQTNIIAARMTKLFFNMWVHHNGMMEVIVND